MTFPETRHSVLAAVRSDDPAQRRKALERLASGYWRAVYTYLRLRFRRSPEDAEDLTQEFFARALDKGWLEAYQPSKGRFRTYLRACLDGMAANQHQAEGRLKRGGGATVVSLDFAGLEGEVRRLELPAPDADVEELFHREWTRSLLGQAVEDLEAWCRARRKDAVWAVFRRYDLAASGSPSKPQLTYADVARQVDLPVTQVTNHLFVARRELRRLVVERLREVCVDESEVEAEVRELFG
jgi:RNA polymerase sigma-70 factor (ECF subfamily)